jgi:hypothetical protein
METFAWICLVGLSFSASTFATRCGMDLILIRGNRPLSHRSETNAHTLTIIGQYFFFDLALFIFSVESKVINIVWCNSP